MKFSTPHKIGLILLTLTVMTTAAATESSASPEFSGNITYTTDYRFRGISQGDRSQAIQGGFDIEADSGLYFGTWASNVTFSGAAIEADYYAGWRQEIDANSAMDFGFTYYSYPEDDSAVDLDYLEIFASYSWRDLSLAVVFSNDYFAETDRFWYLSGSYAWQLPAEMSLEAHLGYNQFDDDRAFSRFIGPAVGEDPGDSYIDYGITLSKPMLGLDWSLAVIGTDLDEDECFAGSKLCDDGIVLSVSRSL